VVVLGVLLLLALLGGCTPLDRLGQNWWELRRDSSGQAPDPAAFPEPIVQIYAARALGWRGVMAVHTWVVLKPTGAPAYTRYEVMGWGVAGGTPAIRVNRSGPDNYWFGARPDLLVDRRGDGVEGLIERVQAAVAAYPYPDRYRTWPGPNSNTFLAYLGRAVPDLRLDLPATAIGKDFIPHGLPVATTPSGTGLQVSLFGLLGVAVGVEEGLELNVLSLNFGVDVKRPALKLPVVGRLGVSRRAELPAPE